MIIVVIRDIKNWIRTILSKGRTYEYSYEDPFTNEQKSGFAEIIKYEYSEWNEFDIVKIEDLLTGETFSDEVSKIKLYDVT